MEEASFVPLLVVVALAFLVPLITSRIRRIRIPTVVGEILAGMIVGQSGLRLVGHDPVLEILSLLGFAYLMFLSGLDSLLFGSWWFICSSGIAKSHCLSAGYGYPTRADHHLQGKCSSPTLYRETIRD